MENHVNNRHEGDSILFVDQFVLECEEEELSESQKATYKRTNEVFEFASALTSINSTVGLGKQLERNVVRSASPGVVTSPLPVVVGVSSSQSQIVVPAQNGFHNGGYVVVDQNAKLLFPSGSNVVTTPTNTAPRPTARLAGPTTTPGNIRIRPPVLNKVVKAPVLQLPVASKTRPPNPVVTLVGAQRAPQNQQKATKSTSTSGIVDLTDEEAHVSKIEPEEQAQLVPSSQNKKEGPQEKTYPSLVVVARTNLSNKSFSQAVINAERQSLDNKLKRTLQLFPHAFTEHLLQQRLIKCDQVCSNHPENKLKLGMFSDTNKFPYSGGYVWIAECCPASFTTVFKGSIFEIGPHPPMTILKLLYHWACQTSVPNVIQWVKVDNSFLKTFYMYLRAVCIAAIHERYPVMGYGGGCKRIEIGVISLGTSSSAGGSREVKVDILGAMDVEAKRVRLRALDPLNMNDANTKASDMYIKKFARILETLKKWVNPKAVIVTDFAVDRNLCRHYGFTNMVQSSDPKLNNSHIMDYLRYVVPRMFQNTLNLLSRSIIQQFLDELVWRETWGQIPSRAYDSIIEHIAEQTKLEGPEDLSVRYTCIASNPNRDWRYRNWEMNMRSFAGPQTNSMPFSTMASKKPTLAKKQFGELKKKISLMLPPPPPILAPSEPPPQIIPELAQIALEPYYYGTIPGDPSKQKATGLFGAFLTECLLCGKDLYSSSAFTNHLVHHALNASSEMANHSKDLNSLRLVCRFCMKPVVNLENHIKDFHKHSHLTKKTMCKICNSVHRDEAALVTHMIYTHCELDLPYFCELCHYRTSIYQDMLVHFESRHNKDTCVQCPYCLKVVRFASRSGEDIPRNQIYFVQHIQKHTSARQVRKCEKCCLSFTNLSTLRNHQEYSHTSCANIETVERYDLNPNDFILMAAPLADPPPPMSLSDSDNYTLQGVALPPSIKIDPQLKFFLCAECDGPITQQHFCVRMTCTRCRYQTCCANAVKEHNFTNHQESHFRQHLIGGRPLLKKPLYCNLCQFSTSNGNKMASHLVEHDHVSDAFALGDKRKAVYLQDNAEDEELSKKRKRSLSTDCNKRTDSSTANTRDNS